MSFTVTDAAVREYANRLRDGQSTGNVFPGKMSDCAFTIEQRERIRTARLQRKAQMKLLKESDSDSSESGAAQNESRPLNQSKASGLTKLEKMLYLQGGNCFFCGHLLGLADASIEHLLPISQGGQRVESNEVVCHKTVNDAFGAMDLKRKMEFIVRSSGQFQCPKANKPK